MSKKTDAIVGIFDSHHELVEALKEFKNKNFPMGHVGVVGKGEALEDIESVHTWEGTVNKTTLIGSAIGLLTGISMVSIPGLGIVFLGGSFLAPIVGGLTGGTLGALGGTILGTVLGAKYGTEGTIQGHEDHFHDASNYKELIEAGKFLLLVHGPKEEVELGHQILKEHQSAVAINSHMMGT